MKSEFIFRIVVLIVFIYAIIAYLNEYINTILLVFLLLGTVIFYIFTQEFNYSVAENKWRFLSTIGSITISISLILNASAFIKNERTQVDQNNINFNKIISDTFGKIEDSFMRETDKLGYLYHNIYYSSGHPKIGNIDSKRDKNLEFQQVLKIFNAMEIVFIAGKLDERKNDPEYRGVINLFDMYASSPLMKQYWKTLRYNFSPSFIKFIEEEFYNYRLSTDIVFVS